MDRLNSPKRILHIVSAMDRGGAETIIMNIYRHLDRNKIQFDFISHSNKKQDFEDEIINLGGRLFKTSSLGVTGPIVYLKRLTKIMSSFPYQAVHAHTDYQAGFPALAAKIVGIKIRICHSHSNNWTKGNHIKGILTHKAMQTMMKVSANRYCGCSHEATRFMFGKQIVKNKKVLILKNGINLNEFTETNSNSKTSVIREFDLNKDVKIIGHVGRFSDSKNHIFILHLLEKLLKKDKGFIALLIGDGPLKLEIEQKANALGIKDHIRFLGVRTDIPRLMKAFDVFLFPSVFEGFGIAALEAQVSGTPCIISDTVTRSTDMELGLASFISLDEPLDIWCEKTINSLLIAPPDIETIKKLISTKGFDIQSNVRDWIKLYEVS